MTDKEKAATEWANKRCPGMDAADVVWCMCREDFLAGYERGEARDNAEYMRLKRAESWLLNFRNEILDKNGIVIYDIDKTLPPKDEK